MNENEGIGAQTGDLVPIEPPKEINTYDLPELTLESDKENTQCFNTSKNTHKKSRFIYRAYSLLCVITVFLTLIFSASELIRFVMDDMGAHDMLMKRIFGYSADDVDNGTALADLIISRCFADLSLKKDTDLPKPVDPPSVPNAPQEEAPENTRPAPSPDDKNEGTTENAPPSDPPAENDPPNNEKLYPIISMDMSLLSYGKNYIYNDTDIKFDVERFRNTLLNPRYDESSDDPLVLIIHTHTTEAYIEEGATHYNGDGEIARSSSRYENMIAVGVEFAHTLEENGVKAVHCTVIHDSESYRLSYQRSAETIEKYLREYPSIQYVFDLHRDSIMRSSGELIRAVTSVEGEECAQIMPVISAGFEGYEENFAFAVKLRDSLNQQYVNLSRPICVRESTYNQDLAPVSLLLEMGTSGNSLSEAKRSASLTAKAVAEIIKNA